MTLFPATVPKPKLKSKAALRDKSPRRRIPTGAPRLVESSTDRAARSSAEAWGALLDAVRRSSLARLELLKGRASGDRVSCPWVQLTGCDAACRCRGAGTVTVEFLRGHYEHLAVEIAMLASPASAQRGPR